MQMGKETKMASQRLFDFAWIPSVNEQLQDLAAMAQPEDWAYRHTPNPGPNPILYSYFLQTFERLQTQAKVTEAETWSCFDTGLVTPNQEEIFALFERHRMPERQPWFFKGFCRESDRALIRFAALPDIATYFDDPRELLYDPRIDLRPDYDHIIDDNYERIPEPYNQTCNEDIKHQLRNILQGAIDHAKRGIQRNDKTAVSWQGGLQTRLTDSVGRLIVRALMFAG